MMSRTGTEMYDVFEVVFYPTLASHGDDDSGGVLQSGRGKEGSFYAHRDEREEKPRFSQGEGKGTTETRSACDLRIAREDIKINNNEKGKKEKSIGGGRIERAVARARRNL